MKKILLFTGSNSPQSINRKLVEYAYSLLKPHEATLIDLRDYALPLYGIETEQKEGVPENAYKLRELLLTHDALIIAVTEHNGSVTAFLKNVLDWLSRTQKDYRVLEHKPILLLSTSPSPGGGRSAIAHAESILKRLSGRVIGTFSIHSFFENIVVNESSILQIKDKAMRDQFKETIAKLKKELVTTETEVISG